MTGSDLFVNSLKQSASQKSSCKCLRLSSSEVEGHTQLMVKYCLVPLYLIVKVAELRRNLNSQNKHMSCVKGRL